MNIWTLPKEPSIRVALLVLQSSHDLIRLALDCSEEPNRQAVHLCDREMPGLGAYLFTYGQPADHYGLQLQYPTQAPGDVPPYDAFEELPLRRVVQLLSAHFDLA